MTEEIQIPPIFKNEPISKRLVCGITFCLFPNRIFYVSIPKYYKITMDVVDEGYRFLNENGGGKFFNIFHFASLADVDPEVREWAANPSGNNYTYSDAIVIDNLSQKILADFYVRINKPVKPTKIFFSLEKAIRWSEIQMEHH